MTYTITGLDPRQFEHLFEASDAVLARHLAECVVADSDSDSGYPCRISLEDAETGDELILLNHVSNDVAKPFRIAHAIYVRRGAQSAPTYRDEIPAMIGKRTVGLRAFSADGMMQRASLAGPGEADEGIRGLLADPSIAYIHVHNAAYGCFLAAVERDQ